jgi:hypothetical protein
MTANMVTYRNSNLEHKKQIKDPTRRQRFPRKNYCKPLKIYFIHKVTDLLPQTSIKVQGPP